LVYLGGPAVRLVGLLFIAFSIRSGYKKYTDEQAERTPWWRIIVGIAIGGALLFGGVPLIIAIAKTVSGIFQNKEKLGVDQIPGANN